jgi:serine phosphatase RsbU (regulator of sigma subunit)
MRPPKEHNHLATIVLMNEMRRPAQHVTARSENLKKRLFREDDNGTVFVTTRLITLIVILLRMLPKEILNDAPDAAMSSQRDLIKSSWQEKNGIGTAMLNSKQSFDFFDLWL